MNSRQWWPLERHHRFRAVSTLYSTGIPLRLIKFTRHCQETTLAEQTDVEERKKKRTRAVEKGGWPHAQAGMSLSSKRILNGGSAEVTSDILLAVCTEGNDGPARRTSSRRISVNDSR